jgi:uncharacterized protein YceH (UPF0502 family)
MDWRRIVSKAAAEEGEDDTEVGSADRLAEGIADIIADAERGNAAEIEKLRNRVVALEQRLSKHGAADAAVRPKTGREEAEDRELRLLVDLRGEMEELRTAMIKLSGRVKALAGA